MTDIQIENLYLFYFLYSGVESSCDFLNQSPDYILEKWNKLINVEIPKTKYPEIYSDKVYLNWSSKWVRGGKNPIPESLMMFVLKTYPYKNKGHILYPSFKELTEYFSLYIGKTYLISQNINRHIHPVFLKQTQNILKDIISTEDKREVILNNMLS